MSQESNVHDYSPRQSVRLSDQANTPAELLHHDTLFESGTILDAGCGTGAGAQTILIAPQNPRCKFVSIDPSPDSPQAAQKAVQSSGAPPATTGHSATPSSRPSLPNSRIGLQSRSSRPERAEGVRSGGIYSPR